MIILGLIKKRNLTTINVNRCIKIDGKITFMLTHLHACFGESILQKIKKALNDDQSSTEERTIPSNQRNPPCRKNVITLAK